MLRFALLMLNHKAGRIDEKSESVEMRITVFGVTNMSNICKIGMGWRKHNAYAAIYG